MEDVRNLRARVLVGVATLVCGVASAVGAALLADWLMRHPPAHLGSRTSGQGDYFALASIVIGFVIGGAISGITIEVSRRRWRRRRQHRALPRMVVVHRT